MGIYSIIKKEFNFLRKLYGFEIGMRQKHGAYYFIKWKSTNLDIRVQYDLRERNPMSILIYDNLAPGTICDFTEYKEEFVLKSGSPRERIHYASEWLKSAIESKSIVGHDK